jgi:hypothetical protein
MDRPLLSASALVSQSWQHYLATWKKTLEISVWYLVPALFLLIGNQLAASVSQAWLQGGIAFVFNLATALFGLNVTVRLVRFLLRADHDPKTDPGLAGRIDRATYLSFLFIALLEVFAVAGGMVLFLLPGIWVGVSLMFSRYLWLEDGIRGFEALASSYRLVKGRWWAVFGRTLLAGLLFSLLVTVVLMAILSLAGFIAGAERMDAAVASTSLVGMSIQYLLQAVMQVILMPLFLTWQVRLFHDLKASRG